MEPIWVTSNAHENAGKVKAAMLIESVSEDDIPSFSSATDYA